MSTTDKGDDWEDFRLLVQCHQRRLTALATRLLNGDQDAAQDVVQEVFLSLWRRQYQDDSPRAPEHLARYLLRAVHNRCVDVLRRHGPDFGLEGRSEEPDIAPGPEKAAQANELAEAVRRAVAELPEAQRSVFLLSHYEGLRYHEIAEILGCPMGTVASRKAQSVQSLRRALRAWSDDDAPGDSKEER